MSESVYNEFQIDKSHDKVSRFRPTFSEGGQCKPPVRRDGTPLWSSPRGAGRPIPVTGWHEIPAQRACG